MKYEYNVFAWVIGLVYMALSFLIALGVVITVYETDLDTWALLLDFIFNAPSQLILYVFPDLY